MKDKKLVAVLVLIIVLLLIGGAYLLGKKENNKVSPSGQYEVPTGPFLNAENDIKPVDYNKAESDKDSWINDSKIGLTYNSKWQVTPDLYRTPAQQENGELLSIVGYRFTLPSGNVINWGGHQAGCTQGEVAIFKYGVSTLACLKGMKANIGLSDVRMTLAKEDINLFGDFVLKNQ